MTNKGDKYDVQLWNEELIIIAFGAAFFRVFGLEMYQAFDMISKITRN